MAAGDTGEWTIEWYTTSAGEQPARAFLEGLTGRHRDEALALIAMLRAHGNGLRSPKSQPVDGGLFELRGFQVRLFYVYRPGRRATLLDGIIKKQETIPADDLKRVRAYQRDLEDRIGRQCMEGPAGSPRRAAERQLASAWATREERWQKERRVMGKETVNQWMDAQLVRSPRLKRRVAELFDAMMVEQDLVALREARGLSQRQLAQRVGVSQPVIAKIEAGRVKNLTLKTLIKITAALGARVRIVIEKDVTAHRRKKAPARRRAAA
jgi:DNA-binding Xre family transcriptional regulator